MKRKLNRKLSLQCLEQRQLMAGDVSVSVVRGDLVIDGDSSGNSIEVYQKPGSSTWYVNGKEKYGVDTTVNGRHGPQAFSGVWDDVRIYTNGGHDRVEVRNASVRDNLFIYTGSGNDDVIVENVYAKRDVKVELSRAKYNGALTGNSVEDYVFMQGVTVGDDIFVRGGTGRDQVILDRVDAKDVINVSTYAGADSVALRRSEADRFFAYLGASSDDLEMENNQLREANIDGGSSLDDLKLISSGGNISRLNRTSITTQWV